MCLILLGVDVLGDVSLVVAANRDELYRRPSAPAGWWTEAPDVLAGRDLEGGGTWLGVTRSGRFAAVTNFREPLVAPPPGARSRGELVSLALTTRDDPRSALDEAAANRDCFGGFNLIAGTFGRLWYLTNRASGGVQPILSGWHGLSNRLLDTPWPKVRRGVEGMQEVVASARAPRETVAGLLDLLADRRAPDDDQLPDTGVGLELERSLGRIFIEMRGYGTRSSTVVLAYRDGSVHFAERTFEAGAPARTVYGEFSVVSG